MYVVLFYFILFQILSRISLYFHIFFKNNLQLLLIDSNCCVLCDVFCFCFEVQKLEIGTFLFMFLTSFNFIICEVEGLPMLCHFALLVFSPIHRFVIKHILHWAILMDNMSSAYSPDLALIAARAATIPSRKGPLAYGTAGFRAKASLPMDYIFYRMGILVSLAASH